MSAEKSTVYRASATAPVNIAVVKYWGKRDSKLNLPTNSSASVTLSQANMKAHTTATCSLDSIFSTSNPDTLVLNGNSEPITGRTAACLAELRALRSKIEADNSALPSLSSMSLRVLSYNNFPTAAGLASSAAGFAALVKAVAELYELSMSGADLSGIARQGSGSACRSMMGGYVAWNMGTSESGEDSVAVPIADADHWPNMRALILVANAAKKDVGSTIGMQRTVATSQLFPRRVSHVVPEHMQSINEAILARDFEKFAQVTMRDSNSFHAVCLDTVPPIMYLTDASRAAISAVTALNAEAGKNIAAYTFDAGPNAVIYFLYENRDRVVSFFAEALDGLSDWEGVVEAARVDGGGVDAVAAVDVAAKEEEKKKETVVGSLEAPVKQLLQAGIKSVIYTAVGEGAKRTEEHLENSEQ